STRTRFRFFLWSLAPLPPAPLRNVTEIGANAAAIETASFVRRWAFNPEFGKSRPDGSAKRIEIGLQVSPMSENIEYFFPLGKLDFSGLKFCAAHFALIPEDCLL